ncbi:formylmethanofuran--tetrahydromethanopterin N-formyltransferase [Dethiosulfatarculus sandiegensis]|uniref:Formylmethanofuran--tetrahydromethanopterin formyltransferase n=1 Tax=Dethiosulfatarculus sandiegensis TaxID=1429043 RepID=A0A0D2GB85_9BACT|nr:formylmethanofuran--tetrahydromethanopterin N-formyltransferase [Dethiosulfatarculus sandiegensis]KIX12132.1 formylmethanofuran--tetrahydromethanopterin formyltransferase [Dethiosulfatarculus sandiegensis]
MQINGVEIEDTFAEAFEMQGAKLIVTALNQKWAKIAANAMTGFATSIIACGCEAGMGYDLSPEQTLDGRPGVEMLFFTMSKKDMEKRLLDRVGQCIMTSPTSACFNDLFNYDFKTKVGGKLRYFGDGDQASKYLEGRRLWRVPVMDGEFLVEEAFGVKQSVGGGNFLILAESQEAALNASEKAIEAMKNVRDVVMPFPGGVVRSGSKTGSIYKGQFASTNTYYCPTLKSRCETALPDSVNSVMEIVIDGLSKEAVAEATRVGVLAACQPGVVRISAGNYGGTLGKFQFHLHEILGQK